jgi:hypothetical protein
VARKRKRRRRRNPNPAAETVAAPAPPARESSRRRVARDQPPAAPWGSFPLVELVVLVALVMLLVGFFSSGPRQPVLIGAGLALGSLAGLELAIREHFSGYRSHILVLAAAPAILTLAILFFTSTLAPAIRLGAALIVFGVAAWALREAFKRASGGLSFRIRGFR